MLLYVSSTGSDSGTCPQTSPCATVSYALTQAASGATVRVSGTIKGHITTSKPVTITTWTGGPDGPGILNGAGSGTVVYNPSAAGVTIRALTIEGGDSDSTGGGISNSGSMALTDSTVTGNGGVSANGIFNNGTMTVTDSTIAANSGAGRGSPGIYNGGSNLTIIASTIAENPGGGIQSGQFGAAFLAATIVADNTGFNCDPWGTTSFESKGYNLTNDASGARCSFNVTNHDLVDKNPQLGPLAVNGGPTRTTLPATNSPAADAIPNPTTLDGVTVCPGTDQRGVARPGHDEARCTIGAVEVSSPVATTSTVTAIPAMATAGARVAFLIAVTPKSGSGIPTGTVTFTTGSTTLCKAVLSGGDAACGSTKAPVGTDTITGTYSGGGGYAASSGTTTLTVKTA